MCYFERYLPGSGAQEWLSLNPGQMQEMLAGGARWAVESGYGVPEDLDRIEERGCMAGAVPQYVSEHAMKRQKHEMGTLGSGNHYLELQKVAEIFDDAFASAFAIRRTTLCSVFTAALGD